MFDLFEAQNNQRLAHDHFQKIKKYILLKQEEFLEHPFFLKITQEESLDKFIASVEPLSFWVMTFQDLLRLNLSHVTSENAYHILKRHMLEDKGHDTWFLDDLKAMKIAEPTVSAIYSQKHISIRDATYTLMSELFRCHNDYERIIFLLTLESAGHVFFNISANLVEKFGNSETLKYFSKYHLNVEKNHDLLLEQKIEDYINILISVLFEEENLLNMIDRIYKAFTSMFNGLVAML